MKLKTVLLLSVSACVPTTAHTRASLSRAIDERVGATLRNDDSGVEQRLPPGSSLAALTEDDAVAIALWNNARFQSDLAALNLSRADLIDAGMIRNPLLTLLLPLGPKQMDITAWFPIEAIWQRPRKVAAAQLEVERTATNLVQTGLNFVRDVKVAWADASLASERTRVARQSVELRSKLAHIAEVRRQAGDSSDLEVVTARVDLRRWELDAQRFEREDVAARERLTALMGLADGTQVALASAPPEARELKDATSAVKEALALRPDVRAAEIALDAALARVDAATAAVVGQVSVIADANLSSTTGFDIGPGFQAELPIFNQNQGPRSRAEAGAYRARWNWLATQQQVANDVRQAHARYVIADEMLTGLRRDVLSELDSATTRASQAFAAGEASYLFVLQTTQQQLDAQNREIEFVAELRRAAAELDRSVGRKKVHAK